MKRTIGLILALTFLVSLTPAYALGFSGDATLEAEIDARKQIVFVEKIAEMESNHLLLHEEEGAISLSISEVKDVYDFSGNKYTLVELAPKGYILFHDESGVFAEYSSRALSPYLGISDELYYVGPKNYYTKDLSNVHSSSNNVVYRHTVTESVLSAKDLVNYDFERASDKLNNALISKKNDNIIGFIQNNTPLQEYDVLSQLESNGFLVAEKNKNPSQRSTTYNGMTVVNNYTFFTRLNNCGYISGGKCGYIAAGMLLAYRHQYFSGTYIPSGYLSWATIGGISYPSISTSLPTALYNTGVGLGYGASTTSREIRFTVNKYMTDNSYTAVSYIDDWIPLANNVKIANCISDDRPVIWFGEVISNTYDSQTWIEHAVLVYGYSFSLLGGYNFMAHFGWDNATEVYFTGVLGSMYTCWR